MGVSGVCVRERKRETQNDKEEGGRETDRG